LWKEGKYEKKVAFSKTKKKGIQTHKHTFIVVVVVVVILVISIINEQ
jgi:uncharacterized membrane protein AbrB (regulator of aidB expression)